tara:strand:- start:839 stop:1003 length:165 start_codon:yes stop_codon:yes gene_type:complete
MAKPKIGLKKTDGAGSSMFSGVNLDSVWQGGTKSKGPKNAKVQAYLKERERQDG